MGPAIWLISADLGRSKGSWSDFTSTTRPPLTTTLTWTSPKIVDTVLPVKDPLTPWGVGVGLGGARVATTSWWPAWAGGEVGAATAWFGVILKVTSQTTPAIVATSAVRALLI
jgi:hypothetical protein